MPFLITREAIMTRSAPSQVVSNRDLDLLLEAPTSQDRLQLLAKWKQQNLTLDDTFVRGFSKMMVSNNEIIAAFEICSTSNKPSVERWIMDQLLTWDQNIAAVALRAWARITDRILWHRLLPIATIPGLPQRIRYAMLDIGIQSHGYEITKAVMQSSDWEDLSHAFHALLMERCLQFDLESSRLTNVAWKIFNECRHMSHPDNRALLAAIGWLCRHDEKSLIKSFADLKAVLWKDILSATLDAHDRRTSDVSKLDKSLQKQDNQVKVTQKLPNLWSRQMISPLICARLLHDHQADFNSFAGIPRHTFMDALKQDLHVSTWSSTAITHVPYSEMDSIKRSYANSPFVLSYNPEKFPLLKECRTLACTQKSGIATDKIKQDSEFCDVSESEVRLPNHPILHYCAALQGQRLTSPDVSNIWSKLSEAFHNPEQIDLNEISKFARKHSGLVTLAFISLMSKLPGRDDAVLKLLDHIRSSDETELCAIAKALGHINTPRSLLELIAMITRPNATTVVQQEIVAMLTGKDLKGLQKELRSAVQDLKLPPNTEHPLYQIKEELSGMLSPVQEAQHSSPLKSTIQGPGAEINLDQELSAMIPHYKDLSSEVKRALRTALFFNKTISDSHHLNAIDLSPLIDMQYKAMELLYREFFEDAVSQSLQKGAIQRKLDVIGYARPIVRQMDEFEHYIASMQVVKDIPFFSKFKLRKMLRALCQFEPGRRFTLDGLKAFGLYFLVFGRQTCKYGLEKTFDVGSKDDLELADFCKDLHIFQDFRNRAAHEGLHPMQATMLWEFGAQRRLLSNGRLKSKKSKK
jgi:hypothetical protein